MSQETQKAEQIISEYTEVWNEQDYSGIPDVVSESFSAILPDEEYHGRDGLEEWIDEVTSAFPDFHVEPVDVVASEDVVMTDAKFTMTHEGEYEGIPPTGEEVEVKQMAKFRVEDGKLKEHRQHIDRQGIAEQLGATED